MQKHIPKSHHPHCEIVGNGPSLNKLLAGFSLVMMLLGLAGCSTTNVTVSTDRTADGVEADKVLLNRLVSELKISPRSLVYLRSKGFTQSDTEFEQIIAKNNKVFQQTRIVRRDDKGVRQLPGWLGIALTPDYKGQSAKDGK